MKKQIFILVGLIILLSFSLAAAAGKATSQKDDLTGVKKWITETFPNMKVTSVSKSPIPGVYEIVGESNQIMYVYPGSKPKEGYVIFGEIWTVGGVSLTDQTRQKLMVETFKNIPLKNAIKSGTGKIEVYEFTDPDCPFCRQSHNYLKQHNDKVTVYSILVPLHQRADKKVMHIICSPDPARAFDEVMSGSLDNKEINLTDDCIKKAKPVLDENMKFSREVGLRGTPLFYVNGKVFYGLPPLQKIIEGVPSK